MHKHNALMSQSEIEICIYNLLKQTEVKFDTQQVSKLAALVVLLKKWSNALNLTAIRDEKDIITLHILDSAVLSPLLLGKNIADVGTGAGFPGLVVAILNEDRHFTLIDSVAKKLSFVRTACIELGISNVDIINNRCENIVVDTPFDCIVSRAFAPLNRMVNWCLPLLSDNGSFIAMKANLTDEEIKAVPDSVKIEKIERLHVPNLDAMRQAVFITKA